MEDINEGFKMQRSRTNSFNLAERIDYGVKAGVRKALMEHKKENKPIFIWKDGKIVEVPPDQIEIPDLPPYPK